MSGSNYAFRLMYLPIGLFGVSIAHGGAAGRVAARRRAATMAGARHTIADGLSLMLMLNVPATVGLVVLARADRAGDLRARQVHGRRHRGHRGRAAVLRDRPGRLFGRPHRLADVLRARAEPHAGHRQRRHGAAQRRAERRSWCACWGSAGWRSARRSPPCSMPPCCWCCCGGDLGRHRGAARSSLARASCVASAAMGVAAWAADAALAPWLPGDQDCAVQIVARRRARSASSLAVLAAAALAARHRRVQPGHGAGHAGGQARMIAAPFGLHRTVLLLASDALPGRRLRQHLHAAAAAADPAAEPVAGRRRHAADVLPDGERRSSQLGFGHVADRWRPRRPAAGRPGRRRCACCR